MNPHVRLLFGPLVGWFVGLFLRGSVIISKKGGESHLLLPTEHLFIHISVGILLNEYLLTVYANLFPSSAARRSVRSRTARPR